MRGAPLLAYGFWGESSLAKQLSHRPDHFQQQAIDSTARGIRIVAPAGSGKSETLARRIAKRVQQDGIDPRRILVLTYDNAAKKSLSGFFGNLLDRKQMPQIRTFNSHGNQILRKYFPHERHELLNIAGSQDALDLKRTFNNMGYDFPVLSWDGVPRSVVETFNSLKNQGFYPGRSGERERQTNWLRDEYLRLPREGESTSLEEYWGMPTAAPSEDTYSIQLSGILDAFEKFDAGMRDLGRMDYEDQKSRAVEQLRRSRSTCEKLQAEFDEIVVDECQDISRLDAMLVYYSAGPKTLVVLAGDDDQTLYEWRNAHSLYLRHPEIVFKDLEFETIHLNLNYRSPQAILGPAVKLISHNIERIEKSPSSGVHDPGEIVVQAMGSHRLLDEALVADIKREIAAGRPAEDIAVLCHARQDREMKIPIEAMLRKAGIPIVKASSDEQVTEPGVWVRSFLKSKGRQWPLVYIPSVNDRDVPDTDSIRKGEVESIRRRFYVAMTRASERLVLNYIRGGDVDRIDHTAEGEVIGTNGASRFLFEAGLVQAQEEPEALPVADATPAPSEQSVEAPSPAVKAVEPANTESTGKTDAATKTAKPEPPKKRVKPKAWEPYAPETRKLAKAQSEWEAGDHDNAIFCAWSPLENVLNRLVKFPPAAKNTDIVTLIDEALVQGIIDMQWKDRLHLWRRVRNQAIHNNPAKNQFKPDKFLDFGFQLVDGAPEFFTHLAERNAPKQLVLETQDEFLQKLSNLVTQIQQGKPSAVHGKPLKAIRFHPEQDKFDILSMQLLMVLRDVRFYIPEEFRWSSSPLISKYSVDTVGHLPEGFRTHRANLLRMEPGEAQNQLMARFERMLKRESGDNDPVTFLRERLDNGLALENGNFHAGLKLNPKAKV